MPVSTPAKSRTPRLHIAFRLIISLVLLFGARPAVPYSLQTHEQLIDLTWNSSIRPLLLSRYPGLTPAQLKEAHAYAFGGCAIQDLGYYPFGSAFFSDLTHYIRSGDFILSLIRNSKTPDELAFSIGALSHYIGDTIGHSQAVNPSVAIEFPELEQRYGPTVTYEDNKHAHVRTEFAFDINEITKHRFAPAAYLEHVGLQIPEPLLAHAFFEIYGLDMHRSLGLRRPVIRGYRFSARRFLPQIAYAEILLHKNSFPADTPGQPFDQLKAELAQADFENGWNQYRRKKAGIRTYLLAGIIFILPKIGVLSDLAIRGPNEQTEERYVESLNHTIASQRSLLKDFDSISTLVPNRDLDTGLQVRPGGYRLTDQTYAKLVHRLAQNPTYPLPTGLKQDIITYYTDPNVITTRKNKKRWAELQADLAVVRGMPEQVSPVPPAQTEDASPAKTD